MEVRFLTLSESMPLSAIKGAKAARDKHGSKNPELLTVPFLSSLDRDDLRAMTGSDDITTHILARAGAALAAGCDGVVASGQEIRLCRTSFPDTIIVSPGIRPIGSSVDDHKRFTTPSEAIRLGADYLVVGRPILNSGTPRKVAEAIIDEIEQAREEKANLRSSSSAKPNQVFMPTSF
jgi:orotidine-5'-phosphate decarboxylase